MDVAYVRDTQLNMRPTLLKLQHMLLCTSQHQPLASAALYAMGLLTLAWPFRAVNSKHKQSNKHCCSATRLRHHTSGHNSHKGEQIHTSKFVDAIFDPSNRKENAGCGSPTAETRPSLRAISRIIGCTSLQHAPQTRPVVTGGRSRRFRGQGRTQTAGWRRHKLPSNTAHHNLSGACSSHGQYTKHCQPPIHATPCV